MITTTSRDPQNKGFYIIKSNPRFSISRTGSVYDRVGEKYVPTRYDSEITSWIAITPPGASKLPALHRVLAEVFVYQEPDIAAMDPLRKRVTFINKDPKDISIENLKWGACVDGRIVKSTKPLRTKGMRKILSTGEVIIYNSIAEMSRALSVNIDVMHLYLKSRKTTATIKSFNGSIIKLDDGSQWPNTNNLDIIDYASTPKALLAKSRAAVEHVDVNGEMTIYSSLTAAGRQIGVTYDMLRRAIYKEGKYSNPSIGTVRYLLNEDNTTN